MDKYIEHHKLDKQFNILDPVAAKEQVERGAIYALDLVEGLDYLLEEPEEVDHLLQTGNFAFGTERI